MTAMQAKFARERKSHPTEWVIVPHRRSGFRLVHIMPARRRHK